MYFSYCYVLLVYQECYFMCFFVVYMLLMYQECYFMFLL